MSPALRRTSPSPKLNNEPKRCQKTEASLHPRYATYWFAPNPRHPSTTKLQIIVSRPACVPAQHGSKRQRRSAFLALRPPPPPRARAPPAGGARWLRRWRTPSVLFYFEVCQLTPYFPTTIRPINRNQSSTTHSLNNVRKENQTFLTSERERGPPDKFCDRGRTPPRCMPCPGPSQ